MSKKRDLSLDGRSLKYLLGNQIAADVRHLAAEAIDLVAFKAEHSGGQRVLHFIQELVDEAVLQPSSFIREGARN